MIAALAAGVLGQLEGLAAASSGVSGLGSVLRGPPSQGAPVAASASGPRNGRPAGLSTLSDQLQTLLLQQQSGATGIAGTLRADDVPVAAIG